MLLTRFRDWLHKRDLKQQRDYAGAQYALAFVAGDRRRCERLKQVIADLTEQIGDGVKYEPKQTPSD